MDALLYLGKVKIIGKYLPIIPVIGLVIALTSAKQSLPDAIERGNCTPVLAADISIAVMRKSDTIQLPKVPLPATTWESRQEPSKFSLNCASPKFDPAKQPLYILNGREIDPANMKRINPSKIKTLTVLKDQAAIGTYGEKAKYGVILISTKKK